jgi:hypothetical protein
MTYHTDTMTYTPIMTTSFNTTGQHTLSLLGTKDISYERSHSKP